MPNPRKRKWCFCPRFAVYFAHAAVGKTRSDAGFVEGRRFAVGGMHNELDGKGGVYPPFALLGAN